MKHHLKSIRMAIITKCTNFKCGLGVEKREPSYAVGVNVNWQSYYGEQYRGSLENSK